ncbi:MAG TPA: hypothetical protein ENK02_12285, partial [Planctomycetes bacterium]|nr:hypothetical protein [Planctomycetota bacterium]
MRSMKKNPNIKHLRFLVQGSAEEPYQVDFFLDGTNMSAYCTCPAGENGLYCKHRFRIMAGEPDNIESDNPDKVSEVAKWVEGSDVGKAWEKVLDLTDAQERIKDEL